MSRRVGGWLLVAAGAISASAAVASPLPPAKETLELEVGPWVLPFRPLAVTVLQNGVLSGRHLAVQLFVDTDLVDTLATRADRTQTALAGLKISPGRHLLRAKSGREVAEKEFRVIPWSWLAGGVALVLSGVAAGIWRRRFRRRPDRPLR